MEGDLCGLDWRAALASMPADLDMEFVKRLLAVAEAHFLSGAMDYVDKTRPRKPN